MDKKQELTDYIQEDKSSEKTMLPKEKFDPNRMLMLARDKSDKGREELTLAISEVFQEELADSEKKLASEIIINLIRQAETNLKQALSEKLAVSDHLPLELALTIAHEDIDVARPVLQHSELLSDVDLIYIINSKDKDYWDAIAKRTKVTSLVSDVLVGKDDAGVMNTLVNNIRAQLSKSSMRTITKKSIKFSELQEPLLKRPEMDPDIATDLYICASEKLRSEIVAKFPIDLEVVDKALEEIVQDLINSNHGRHEVTDDMKELAIRFYEREEITPHLLINTLRRGQLSFFLALFSRWVEVDSELVYKMLQKDGGKPLAVVCKFKKVIKPEFASIFLLSRAIRMGDQNVDVDELSNAIKCFDELSFGDARDIIYSWQRKPDLL